MSEQELEWISVGHVADLPEGRVKTVTAGTHSMALTNIDGEFTAMDNRCPHQGGPLGEGSIEVGSDGQCWLRCPWHGWDFDPKTGLSPGAFEDSGQKIFPIDVRDDGIYIGLEAEPPHENTVTDIMARTMTNWGVTSVFGIVGHSNLGLADALRALRGPCDDGPGAVADEHRHLGDRRGVGALMVAVLMGPFISVHLVGSHL